MKLARIRTPHGLGPAVIDANGTPQSLAGHIAGRTAPTLSPLSLPGTGRVFGLRLTSSDHATETGMTQPRVLAQADAMRLGVSGLGGQRQEAQAWHP